MKMFLIVINFTIRPKGPIQKFYEQRVSSGILVYTVSNYSFDEENKIN